MNPTEVRLLSEAIREALLSPNVPDTNLEPANLVDTTNYMANDISSLSRNLQKHGEAVTEAAETIAAASSP